MTVSRDTKSYPYLAIAQYNNVDYGRVLLYSENLIKLNIVQGGFGSPPFTQWRYEVWRLEKNKLKKS